MYNELQKKEYIGYAVKENENAEIMLTRIFNQVEEFEKKYNTDVCNFTMTNITTFYKSLFISSFGSLYNIHCQLRKYSEWCNSYNLSNDTQNPFDLINKDIVNSCLNIGLKKVEIITRKELEVMVERFSNVYEKVIVMGVFEGLGDNNMLSLRTATIDNIAGNKFRMIDGREVEISDKLKGYMLESIKEQNYISLNRLYERSFSADSAPFILKGKGVSKEAYMSYSTANTIFRYYKSSEIHEKCHCLSVGCLKNSGRLHMIKNLYKDSTDDLRRFVLKNKENIEERYGSFIVSDFLANYGEYV